MITKTKHLWIEVVRTRSRWLRAAVVVLSLALGIAAFYAFENWRGNRAWESYAESVRESGGSLEPVKKSQLRGKPEADPKPELKAELAKLSSVFFQAEQLMKPSRGDSVDLIAYAAALVSLKDGSTNHAFSVEAGSTNKDAKARAALVVLEAFSTNSLLFQKLRAALHENAYPFGYGYPDFPLGPSPEVYSGLACARLLKLKAVAELALGNTRQALEDLDLVMGLSDSLSRDHPLIASIGSIGCRNMGMLIAREGLEEHRFAAAELVEVHRMVVSTNVLRRHLNSALLERNHLLAFIDLKQQAGTVWNEISDVGPSPLVRFIPSGWVQLEKVKLAESWGGLVKTALSAPNMLNPSGLEQAEREVFTQVGRGSNSVWRSILRHTTLASFTPSVSKMAQTGSYVQVSTDQIWIGAKLEHYCLQHGTYPELLEAVAQPGQPMPLDPFTNQPYRYRREPDGGYTLWSVGWNQKDDGGKTGSEPFDPAEGDWVLSVRPRTL